MDEKMTVEKIIRGVEKKQFLLPTIQRGFVWESKKIEDLFDSIMRGFPISSFLFWEVPDEEEHTFKFYDFIKDYNFYGEDPRSFAEFKKAPHMAVLDGQQRITSFYIGLKGSYIPKSNKRGRKSNKDLKLKKLYLNLLKINADDNNGDADAGLDNVYEFKFLTEDDAAKRDAETFWFEVGKILDSEFDNKGDIADFLFENELVDGKSYLKLPYKILDGLWDCIRHNEVIKYYSTENKKLDDVLNIFVRINNGGKAVALSDLLVSLATVHLKKHSDIANELTTIVKEVNNIGGKNYFNVSRDFILRTFLVCADNSEDKKSIKFDVDNFKDDTRMKKIDDNFDKMVDAIKKAVTLVKDFGFTQKHFASNNALIPLAHYIYLNENYAAEKGKMIHWFISATLGGVFSSRTDEQLNEFRKKINKNHESFPLKEMLKAKDKTDEEIAENLVDLIMEANYGYGKSAWMALAILYDDKNYTSPNAEYDIDHMFPKSNISALKNSASQGILDKSKETELESYYENFVDSLPNLQILTAAENKKKSSTYFSDWIKTQSEEYLDENFVPDVKDFRLVNFKNFIDEREKLIRKKIFDNLKTYGVI